MGSQNWFDIISKFSPATLIGGIGGYFLHVLQARSQRRRMRRHLYREISINNQYTVVWVGKCTSELGTGIENLQHFSTLLAAAQPFTEKLDLSFNVWNFYKDEKRREMLFELAEAEAIHRIYDKFIVIGNEGRTHALLRAMEATDEVDERLLDGTLDKKVYRKVSAPNARRYMDDLLTGKRVRIVLSPR
jgi:hypothetical protein